jgi:hypothetical protein
MTDVGSHQGEALAGQRQRLRSLQSCEDRIKALREQECDLEVEHIAARAALANATKRLRPEIDLPVAVRIGRIVEQRRELADGLSERKVAPGPRSTGDTRQKDRLRSGRAALQAWLNASQPQEPTPVAKAAKITLLIATIATVWAAVAIHLAFLLLLAVVIGPVSFAMGRGQDTQWKRVGARRRFGASGLADMPVWDDESVAARLAELDKLIANTNRGSPPARLDTHAVSHPASEDEGQLESLLESAGLTMDATQGDMGEWLRLVARENRSLESLQRVKTERLRLRAEASEYREQLQGYLQSRGVKPTQLQDTAAIAEGLDRLSRSTDEV